MHYKNDNICARFSLSQHNLESIELNLQINRPSFIKSCHIGAEMDASQEQHSMCPDFHDFFIQSIWLNFQHIYNTRFHHNLPNRHWDTSLKNVTYRDKMWRGPPWLWRVNVDWQRGIDAIPPRRNLIIKSKYRSDINISMIRLKVSQLPRAFKENQTFLTQRIRRIMSYLFQDCAHW